MQDLKYWYIRSYNANIYIGFMYGEDPKYIIFNEIIICSIEYKFSLYILR